MNKVSEFITKEIFNNDSLITIDTFCEVLKTIPHIMSDNKLIFDDEEVKKIRRIIGFFVSTQFGDYFIKMIGNTCVKNESTRIGFEYFTTINDMNQFIEVCNLLDVGITLEYIGVNVQSAFIIYNKKEDQYNG